MCIRSVLRIRGDTLLQSRFIISHRTHRSKTSIRHTQENSHTELPPLAFLPLIPPPPPTSTRHRTPLSPFPIAHNTSTPTAFPTLATIPPLTPLITQRKTRVVASVGTTKATPFGPLPFDWPAAGPSPTAMVRAKRNSCQPCMDRSGWDKGRSTCVVEGSLF